MTEWHVTPDYIVNNWTDEELELMCDKLVERKKQENELVQKSQSASPDDRVVTDTELFRQLGNKVKVVKGENK